MIVADASVTIEALLDPFGAPSAVLLDSGPLQAPDLIGLEVLHSLRALVRGQKLALSRAGEAIEDFEALRLVRHAHRSHEARVWELRRTMTAHDAAYVALAEALELPLLTTDVRLARAAGDLIEVVVPTS